MIEQKILSWIPKCQLSSLILYAQNINIAQIEYAHTLYSVLKVVMHLIYSMYLHQIEKKDVFIGTDADIVNIVLDPTTMNWSV